MVAAGFASADDGAARVVGWGLSVLLGSRDSISSKPQPTKLADLRGLWVSDFLSLGSDLGSWRLLGIWV